MEIEDKYKIMLVVNRFLTLIYSLIVLVCILKAGYNSDGLCSIFLFDESACNFGIALPVVGIIALFLFLVFDFTCESIRDFTKLNILSTLEIIFTLIWSFLWLVGFCLLVNRWNSRGNNNDIPGWRISSIQAAISFSFFSIFTWIYQFIWAIRRYRIRVRNFEAYDQL